MPSNKTKNPSRKVERRALDLPPASPIMAPADFHFEQLAGSSSEMECEEIVERALQLIGPLPNQIEACRHSINTWIAVIGGFRGRKERSSGEINYDIEKLLGALRRTKAALNKLFKAGSGLHLPMTTFDGSDIVRSILANTQYKSEWTDFYNLVSKKITLLERRYNSARKGGPVSDPAKLISALHSFDLLMDFGRKRPTKTSGGVFYELASLLYEGAIGVQNANLERYCRKIFESKLKQSATFAQVREAIQRIRKNRADDSPSCGRR
jgi:hypothetical protein